VEEVSEELGEELEEELEEDVEDVEEKERRGEEDNFFDLNNRFLTY